MEQDRFVSYAQNLEDVLLWRALRGAIEGPGFYIDVGASDPTVLSVTRAFYERGWHGLNIEPLPDAAARLRAERPRDVTVEAAVAATAGRRVFHRVAADGQTGLSTLDAGEAGQHGAAGAEVSAFEVEVETLAALCRAHVDGAVHFLKIDAEGAEAEVLAGADFRAVRPWIVVVEATRPGGGDRSEAPWEPGLLAAGYRAVWFDGLNRFYVAEEHADLARHFALPPNVFDAYVQYDPVLEGHMAQTQALADERGALIGRLRAELARLEAQEAARLEAPQGTAVVEPGLARRVPDVPQPDLPQPDLLQSDLPQPEVPVAGVPHFKTPTQEVPMPGVQAGVEPGYLPHGWARRLARRLYFAVRPVFRPVGWRVRGFLTDELGRQMIDMRAKQDLVLRRIELLEDKIELGGASGAGAGLAPGHADVLGRALLTLALDAERGPWA